MTEGADVPAVNVVPLRTPARIVWEALGEIRASFPGWHVWHTADSATWNAHRKGQEPYFGPLPEGAPVFMVSASRASQLVALLECQTLGDMTREFSGWRIGRTATGSWYALTRGRYGVRLVQGQDAAPLEETVRALTRHCRRDSVADYCSPPAGGQNEPSERGHSNRRM
jgi:hypothetical protein